MKQPGEEEGGATAAGRTDGQGTSEGSPGSGSGAVEELAALNRVEVEGEAEEGEAEEPAGGEEGAGAGVEEPVRGISAKAQARIDGKIAKAHGEAKQAQEERDAALKRAEAAEAEAARLKGLVESDLIGSIGRSGVSPEYVTEADARLFKRNEDLRDAHAYLMRYSARNEAGQLGEKEPVLSAEDVAQRLLEIDDERLDVAPAASARRRELLELQERHRRKGRETEAGEGKGKVSSGGSGAGGGAPRAPAVSAGGGVRPLPRGAAGPVRRSGELGPTEQVSVEDLRGLYREALGRTRTRGAEEE